MIKPKFRLRDRVLSLLAGAVVAFAVSVPFYNLGAYTPYKDVEVHSVLKLESDLFVSTSFTKVECSLSRFVVVGDDFGQPKYLDWIDLDGDKGDRLAGRQYIDLKIDLEGRDFHFVELRTRHICPNDTAAEIEVVDRVYARIEVP